MSKHNLTFMHVDVERKRGKYEKEKERKKIRSCTHTQLALLTKERELLKESPLRDVTDKASSLFINCQNNR